MERTHSIRRGVLFLALFLPLLGPLGCASNPPQFMGGGQPDAWHPTPGQSARNAATQVGVVVGGAALVVGGAIGAIWLLSLNDDRDDPRDVGMSGWE